ncbi:hypothetical protein BJP36_09820 [Moorena producens JHB]|uniref:Uncharacterized protein n=1 Tax=Moorena producens (strain JHB) TaxID=1454205 RepID=A0A1D9FXT8_MOOP1|nr:hypothetical protein [Moorena producens]AOY80179.1 hypothetical protein BJP36_09820 [Moorena producens JHB]
MLALKGNQGKLTQQVKDWFQQAQAKNWEGIKFSYHQTIEGRHLGIETRECWAVSVAQLPALHRQSLWEGNFSMGGVLGVIGTPAVEPKVRGKSPGWEFGRKRNKGTVYPLVKKATARNKNTRK